MKKLLLILLLVLPITVTALPTVLTEVTRIEFTVPTQNTDGSPLTDLAGFKVYWSATSGGYADANSQTFNDPTMTVILLSDINLPEGDAFLAMTAINTAGLESDFSSEGFAKKLGAVFYQNAGTVPAVPSNFKVM